MEFLIQEIEKSDITSYNILDTKWGMGYVDGYNEAARTNGTTSGELVNLMETQKMCRSFISNDSDLIKKRRILEDKEDKSEDDFYELGKLNGIIVAYIYIQAEVGERISKHAADSIKNK
jgi:hypothetical protein